LRGGEKGCGELRKVEEVEKSGRVLRKVELR
jgi:hypothetical protein